MSNSNISLKNLFLFIWKFISIQRWKFFGICALSLAWPLDATLWPYLLGRIIDTFTHFELNRDVAWPALKWLLISGVIIWTTVETSFRTRGFMQARFFPKLEADIRMAMFDHIQHHSPRYFNEHFSGSLANKIADMTTQVTWILQNCIVFLMTFVTCLVTIIFFFQINAFFALILAALVFLHITVCIVFARKCAEYSAVHGEVRSNLMGKIVDSLTNNFAVNLFFRFRFERNRVSVSQKVEQEKNYQAQRYVEIMFVVLSGIYILGIISLNGLMVLFWIKGKITTGETIQIFNTAWNVFFMLWVAGEEIPRFYQSLGIARQALTVMYDPQDVLDTPNAKPLVIKRGEIVFENVSFQYGERQLFQNKNVHIKAGEKVGLVGYSGSGKSTFVNLILRFYPLLSGRILIDNQDIAQVTLESLRHDVALIPQDPLLFHRTLEENIQYGRIDAAKDEVYAAAKLAHCDEFIKKTPKGYESLVGERGTKLSGGERQRIAIARAMLAASPILILDEATSSLDSVTENYIQDSLEKVMQNRTTIVVAHRLSTLSKMDRILVFDTGKIVEEGTHEQLIQKEGHYAKMWNMQAGGFLPDQPL